MKAKAALEELRDTLRDAAECGDLLGHLAAWFRVATGRVHSDDRVELAPPAAEGEQESRPEVAVAAEAS